MYASALLLPTSFTTMFEFAVYLRNLAERIGNETFIKTGFPTHNFEAYDQMIQMGIVISVCAGLKYNSLDALSRVLFVIVCVSTAIVFASDCNLIKLNAQMFTQLTASYMLDEMNKKRAILFIVLWFIITLVAENFCFPAHVALIWMFQKLA